MKKETKTKQSKSITQLEVAKLLAEKLNLSIEVITQIVEAEQKLTMKMVKDGVKVVKKNYITLTPIKCPARSIKSALTRKTYTLPEHNSVRVSIGEGFKAYLGKKPMKNKICRFVGEPTTERP